TTTATQPTGKPQSSRPIQDRLQEWWSPTSPTPSTPTTRTPKRSTSSATPSPQPNNRPPITKEKPMAVTAKLYGLFLKSLANKEIDLETDTLKVMLCTSSYSPNQDTHQYKSSVTNEVSGTGYTAGGKTLTGVTVTYDTGTNTLTLDADDVTWSSSTITARYAVFYDDTAVDAP